MTLESEYVYHSFAQWIVACRRQRRPYGLFVVGVNGSVGQGKSVFSRAVVRHLNTLIKSPDGKAVTRSLDDYYLPKAERYRAEFLSRGYNPEDIPNRGPAGTHDTQRLWNDIQAMDQGFPRVDLPSFDKQTDDRSAAPFRVEGKVSVFILEGWFVGARTDVDPMKADPGLKRSVAQALRDYKPIFDRINVLWAFEPPTSLAEIVAQRIKQQETLDQSTGKTGMTAEQIRRFVRYFYVDAWQEGLTSPVPPREAASFWATMDAAHRFLKITPEF